MDPRDRADAMIARARARHGHIVTPEDVSSPMDAMNTMQIPRSVVDAADGHGDEPEITKSIPGPAARARSGPAAAQQHEAPRGQPDEGPAEPPTGPLPALAAETVTTHLPPTGARQVEPPAQPPQPREVDGLVPTVQEPSDTRSLLSRRLDGDND